MASHTASFGAPPSNIVHVLKAWIVGYVKNDLGELLNAVGNVMVKLISTVLALGMMACPVSISPDLHRANETVAGVVERDGTRIILRH